MQTETFAAGKIIEPILFNCVITWIIAYRDYFALNMLERNTVLA